MNFLVKMMNFWFKMMNSFTLQVEQVGAMAIILNSVSVLQVRFRLISDYFSTVFWSLCTEFCLVFDCFSTVFGRFVLNSVAVLQLMRPFTQTGPWRNSSILHSKWWICYSKWWIFYSKWWIFYSKWYENDLFHRSAHPNNHRDHQGTDFILKIPKITLWTDFMLTNHEFELRWLFMMKMMVILYCKITVLSWENAGVWAWSRIFVVFGTSARVSKNEEFCIKKRETLSQKREIVYQKTRNF